MGGLIEGIFGGRDGGGKAPDWQQIEKLMKMSLDANRFDQQGLFSNTTWKEGPDGKWARSQSVNPALQGGMDRLMGRAGGAGMGLPSQMNDIMNAKMINQMQRQGIQAGGPPDQGDYGAPVQDQMNPEYAPTQPQPLPPPPQAGPGGPGGGYPPGLPPGFGFNPRGPG